MPQFGMGELAVILMPHLGMGELIIILMLALLVFGATRLPQIGEGMGRAIRNFKRGLSTDEEIDVTPEDRQVSSESGATSLKDEAVQRETSESKS